MWNYSRDLPYGIQYVFSCTIHEYVLSVVQAILKLEEDEDEAALLTQYAVKFVFCINYTYYVSFSLPTQVFGSR